MQHPTIAGKALKCEGGDDGGVGDGGDIDELSG